MNHLTIKQSTLDFLQRLSLHNNREWFNDHRQEYEQAKENVEGFMDGLISKMNEHDRLENESGKKSVFRIYNDVRFSKDKAPYNPRFAGYLTRSKPQLRGGYFLRIKPRASAIRCGFTNPNPEDLKRIRQDISADPETWKKLLASKSIRDNFGSMKGAQVLTAPRGFSKENPAIDLLRYKQFMFEHPLTNKEVLAPDFLLNVNKTYKAIRPFFNHMSEILTTNINGEPLF